MSSGGSGGAAPGSVRIVGPHAPPPAHGSAHNTAYIVRRVRARIADADNGRGVVLSTVNKTGYPIYRNVTYYNPRTGILYQNDKAYTHRGRELFVNVDATIPIKNYVHFHSFSIDYGDHTWSDGWSVAAEPFPQHLAPSKRSVPPSAMSPASVVEKALSSHIATRTGMAKIDGIRVIVLKSRAVRTTSRCTFDAQTYQPLRETERMRGKFQLDRITSVLPATRANISRAKNPPKIPSGYSRSN